jgi:methionyl-tRNA formyltransferase
VRVVFAGSPAIALPALEGAAGQAEVVAVLTNPDSQSGRGLQAARTPVALKAAELGIPVLTFERLGSEARAAVEALHPDLLVSFAYGRLFGPRFMALFPLGGINIHPSLLPRHRGASPIPAAILARDSETGVSIQAIAPELDSGDLYAVGRIALDGRETTASLSEKAARLGADLLADLLPRLAAGGVRPRPQEGEPTFCTVLGKDEGLVDWQASALDIDARVRAFDPWPGAFTWLGASRLALLETEPFPAEAIQGAQAGTIVALDKSRGIMVQTGEGLLALRRLQLQTKKALPWRDFANGVRDLPGSILGKAPAQESRTQA